MNRLAGRISIVTGAAEGPKAALGAVIARALAAEQSAVVVADVLDCSSVADAINAAGGSAHAARVDVSDEHSVAALIEETRNAFGPPDILVNNAVLGSNIPPVPIDNLSVDEWDRVFAVNVRGPFLCARAVAPDMRARGYGKIINIGSGTALEGLPNRLHYVASKGAVQAMTRALARELGPDGIRVNTLAPGLVMNAFAEEMFAERPEALAAVLAGRSIKEDVTSHDLIGTLIYLASPDSDAVTGQCVVVDNGGLFL